MTQVYEVKVEGQLGEPLLRYLRWSHRVEPAHATVRLQGISAADLSSFLEACGDEGVTIEKVTRL